MNYDILASVAISSIYMAVSNRRLIALVVFKILNQFDLLLWGFYCISLKRRFGFQKLDEMILTN